jgi:hypothetical protein
MKIFIISIFLLSIASWAFFGYIVWFIPPELDGELVFSNLIYFLTSGAFALGFTTGLILYFIGNVFLPKVRGEETAKGPRRLLFRSLRRGLFFSILVVSIATLNVFDLLNILNGILVVGIALLAEIFFSSR